MRHSSHRTRGMQRARQVSDDDDDDDDDDFEVSRGARAAAARAVVPCSLCNGIAHGALPAVLSAVK